MLCMKHFFVAEEGQLPVEDSIGKLIFQRVFSGTVKNYSELLGRPAANFENIATFHIKPLQIEVLLSQSTSLHSTINGVNN